MFRIKKTFAAETKCLFQQKKVKYNNSFEKQCHYFRIILSSGRRNLNEAWSGKLSESFMCAQSWRLIQGIFFPNLNRKHLQSIPQYYLHLSFLQSACANAIRNIVSRSKELVPEFIALDVEPLLNDILEKHPQSSYACKRALTDLDLHVVLEEKWTGGAVKQDDE